MTLRCTVGFLDVLTGAVRFLPADDPEGSFVPPEFDNTGSTFEVSDQTFF